MVFVGVQLVVEAVADALFTQFGLDPHADDARLQSWRAELELAGVNAFMRVRLQLRDDSRRVVWKDHAKRAMTAKFVELMVYGEPGDDDGLAGVPADPRPLPTPPGLSALILTPGDLYRAASRKAAAYWARRYRSWSSDSELASDIQQDATAEAADRARRRWDPERGGLDFYLHVAARSGVDDAFRRALHNKIREGKYVRTLEVAAAAEVRDGAEDDTADITEVLSAVHRRQELAVALSTLTERRRNEILLRLVDDRDRTQPDHNAYSKGLQDLRNRLDDYDNTEDRADPELVRKVAKFLACAGDGAISRLTAAPTVISSAVAVPLTG